MIRQIIYLILLSLSINYFPLEAQSIESKQLSLLLKEYEKLRHYDRKLASNKLSLAQKLSKNNHKLPKKGLTYYYIGRHHYYVKNNDSCLHYLDKAISFANTNNQDSLAILSKTLKGVILYFHKNKRKQGSSLLFELLGQAKKGKFHQLTAQINNYIAFIYLKNKQFIQAKKAYKDLLKFSLKYRDTVSLGKSFQNFARIHLESKTYDSAFYFYQKAQYYTELTKDYYRMSHIQIGLIQAMMQQKKHLNKIPVEINRFKLICQKLKDEKALLKHDYLWAQYYTKIKDYKKSIDYGLKTLRNHNSIKINPNTKLSIYSILSLAFEKEKNFSQSIKYHRHYTYLNDSIRDIKNAKSINELQTKYSVREKNLKIQVLTKDKEIETIKKNWVILIGLMVLIPLIFSIIYFIQKNKSQKIIREKEQLLFQNEKIRLKQEQSLKQAQSLIKGQEKERNRLAKELHDGLGGQLATLKLGLSKLNKTLKNNTLSIHLNGLENTFKDLRNISHNLSLNYIKQRTLIELIHELRKQFEQKANFKIETIFFPQKSFNSIEETIKLNLYRIAQELLSNALKHSKAQYVSLSYTIDQNQIRLIYEDDGIGFKQNNHIGIGIANIKERLQSIKGTLTIDGSIRKGCCIIIEIENHN